MALNPMFQVGLDVRGRICLVIGGDGVAQDKVERLLDAGARVVVISPEVTPRLRDCATDPCRLEWRQRHYESEDLDGAFLVMNTIRGNSDLCRRVFSEAGAQGILVNTYDDVDHSHFGMVALVSAGHLRLGVSTSGASPTLAGRLRQDLDGMFDEEFGEYLETLGCARASLREAVPDFPARREILQGLVAGVHVEGRCHLPEGWRERITAALAAAGTKKTG